MRTSNSRKHMYIAQSVCDMLLFHFIVWKNTNLKNPQTNVHRAIRVRSRLLFLISLFGQHKNVKPPQTHVHRAVRVRFLFLFTSMFGKIRTSNLLEHMYIAQSVFKLLFAFTSVSGTNPTLQHPQAHVHRAVRFRCIILFIPVFGNK